MLSPDPYEMALAGVGAGRHAFGAVAGVDAEASPAGASGPLAWPAASRPFAPQNAAGRTATPTGECTARWKSVVGRPSLLAPPARTASAPVTMEESPSPGVAEQKSGVARHMVMKPNGGSIVSPSIRKEPGVFASAGVAIIAAVIPNAILMLLNSIDPRIVNLPRTEPLMRDQHFHPRSEKRFMQRLP